MFLHKNKTIICWLLGVFKSMKEVFLLWLQDVGISICESVCRFV